MKKTETMETVTSFFIAASLVFLLDSYFLAKVTGECILEIGVPAMTLYFAASLLSTILKCFIKN